MIFAISFSNPFSFVALSEEWDVVEITATQIRLKSFKE
jgi:hypothetical protein